MKPSLFDRALFGKTLAVTIALVVAGLAVAFAINRELSTVDVVGATISGVILAYVVHLWIMPQDR